MPYTRRLLVSTFVTKSNKCFIGDTSLPLAVSIINDSLVSTFATT